MKHFVYILECADKTLYVGATNNLEKRVHEHNHAKSGAHYTKIRRPAVLVYSETSPSLRSARAREAEIKRMKKIQKLELMVDTLNEWRTRIGNTLRSAQGDRSGPQGLTPCGAALQFTKSRKKLSPVKILHSFDR